MNHLKEIKNKKHKGFTLVELVVVIGILAVLAVLATVAYSNLVQEARRSALRADAAAVVRSINLHNTLCAGSRIITTAPTPTGTPANTISLPLTTAGGDMTNFDMSVVLGSAAKATAVVACIQPTGSVAGGNLRWEVVEANVVAQAPNYN